ncbi:unnamed protein product [Mycena citricolor]|uniref:Transcription initiation factor TFIID subunit 8 n=1 Tax=Mycena citricolor TaxID=2018698 RepID=A0AAD2GSR8_9AGAR|nr:unnamed protein product [Mycena citricolor]
MQSQPPPPSSYYAYQTPATPAPAPAGSYNPYAQYSTQIPGYSQSYFASYHLPPAPPPKPATPPPADLPPPPPDLTSITPAVASGVVQRLIVSELKAAGFASAQSKPVELLERNVVAFIERLYERAHQYANLSNRSSAIVTDLILASDEFGLPPEELRPLRKKLARRKKKGKARSAPTLDPAPSRSPSPERLPSDDETQPAIPLSLRGLPHTYPTLPPKHTYLRTPASRASPPKRAAIPTLEKKLETAARVQTSLKNLMIATEDAQGQEDGELLGHIVNCETYLHPRKRWKLTRKRAKTSHSG